MRISDAQPRAAPTTEDDLTRKRAQSPIDKVAGREAQTPLKTTLDTFSIWQNLKAGCPPTG